MKIKMLESCAGTRFSYAKGASLDVPDKVGKDLVKAGYAESLGKKKKTDETDSADTKADDKTAEKE